MRANNRERLKQRGLVVYLYTEVEQQWKRTRKSRHRPLLRQDNPKKVLKELMALRDPWYRDVADLVVNSKAQSAKSLARMIHELKVPRFFTAFKLGGNHRQAGLQRGRGSEPHRLGAG